MPTRWETFPIEVGGGFYQLLPSIQQGLKLPGSAIRLINFEPSLDGGYRRINGFTKFDANVVPSADNTTNLLGVGFLDGKVIVPREDKIYSSEGAGWTEIASGRTQTTKHRFSIINLDGTRKIIGVDGSNYPYSWDGTTFTDISGFADVLGASHVTEFVDHVFYAKGDLVTFTAPFDETDFSSANGAGNFRMPSTVTGMIVFRERLFVFTESEIKVLDGTSASTFRLTSVSNSVGCVAPDTIQEVAGDVMFLAEDGLRLLGATDRIGDFRNENASKNIQPAFTSFTARYNEFSSTIVREKSQYRIFGYDENLDANSSEGFLGTQFQPADPNSLQWAQTEGLKVFAATSNVYNQEELIYFINDSEYVYQMESGDDFDSTAIHADFRTPFISFGDPTFRKTIYSVTSYIAAEGSVSGSLQLDFNQSASNKIQPAGQTFSDGGGVTWDNFNWGEAVWADETIQGSVKVVTSGAGNSCSFEYTFTENNAPFTIDTLFIEYSVEDRK